MTTFTLCGGGVIDLRYADFTSPEVEIHTYSIMGGQTILVPPEVNVELRGHGVMGTFDHLENSEGMPGAPLVRVRGFSLWGKVAVKRKKRSAV
jgi:predicted membrane protein